MRLGSAPLLFLGLCLLCGCRQAGKPDFSAPIAGEKAESQWEMVLEEGGNSMSFTGAAALGLEPPHAGKLYIILPYGQTLAKCVLDRGEAVCEPAPGAGPLVRKTAEPMARIADAAFKSGRRGMLTPAHEPPAALRGAGWRAEVDGAWLVYREDGAGWRLRLRRNK